ncbi:hypothetical protein NC651_025745 [Populus alba x Populus x berolinensis]|nr:hypothetical protein NC651_025745 [Populus alba x Populus x berolinensis]
MRGVLAKFPQNFTLKKATMNEFPVYGSLDVGFVDTKNVLYTQKLQVGDMFIFPKGLVHYQSNPTKEPAVAISSFGSANAGTVSVQQELMMEFLPKHSRPMFIPFKRSSPALASPEPSLDSSKKACTFVFQAINNYSLGSESRLMFVRTSKS